MNTAPTPSAPIPPQPIAGREFLESEELLTQKAIQRTLAELRATLLGGSAAHPESAPQLNVDTAKTTAKNIVDSHPLLSVLGAAAAGFTAAVAIVPSKEEQVLKKLAALERAVALQGGDVAQPKPGGQSLTSTLIGSLAGLVKPMLLHTITSALAAQQAAGAPAEDQHPEPPTEAPSPAQAEQSA